MSVIIDDFEVVVDTGQKGAADGSSSEGGGSKSPIAPMDIQDVLRQQAERQARIRAD